MLANAKNYSLDEQRVKERFRLSQSDNQGYLGMGPLVGLYKGAYYI